MLSLNLQNMRFRFAFILLCVLLMDDRNICHAQVVEIQGFVRTTEGQPISGVSISRLGKTDERGHFKIASDVLIRYWTNLIFDKKGFVPKLVSLDPSNASLYITLESEKDKSVWDIPTCGYSKGNRSKVVGEYLRLTILKGMKFKTGVDVDYIYYSIGLSQGGNNHWLHGGWGNLYGNVYPSGEALLRLDHYSYRRTSVGIDWRGLTKDGKYWRYFGASPVFETYYYETDSRQAADAFDIILDAVCLQSNR